MHTQQHLLNCVSSFLLVFFAAIPQDQTGQLDLLKPRLVFCAIQIAGLLFALNKLQGMGLLPTNPSDYVSFLKLPVANEYASGGITLGR